MRPELSPALLNRVQERTTLDDLLGDLRSGQGRALTMRGEAGVGKSALLEYLVAAAVDMRVARAAGVESEMELPFAGLHLLCVPLLDRLEALPGPQRDALGVAFGLRVGSPPDRFLVALAVLTLLAEAAEERPLLCVIDDAQWLDLASAQVLAFAARRLLAEPVGLVFAAREPGEQFRGVDDLEVPGLADQDARTLLQSVIRFRLDQSVLDQIVAEAGGNPLALLELPRGLAQAQLAGGLGLVGVQPIPARVEQAFGRRLEALPADTRSLMLIAAAEPTGDPVLMWRAAARLGIQASAAEAAQADGLLETGTRVRFRHPLVRSAVYAAASLPQRRATHRALAEVTDRGRDPDRRAWHLAAAAPGPDEQAAAELERSAGRAQARGGIAAAAASLERAVELTKDPAPRAARALAAAQATFEAAVPETAGELLSMAESGPLDDLQRARAGRLRAQITFARNRGSDAPALLLNAAKAFEGLDDGVARETHLEAFGAALFAGRLGGRHGLREVAEAARSAPSPQSARPSDLLLDGMATRYLERQAVDSGSSDGAQAGVRALQGALEALRRENPRTKDEIMRLLWLSPMAQSMAVHELWDYEGWRELSTRSVRLAREVGALTALPGLLVYFAGVHVFAGEFAAAEALFEEADAITAATGNAPMQYAALFLAAWRGEESSAVDVMDAAVKDATARGEGRILGMAGYATAVLNNGLGRYPAALAGARLACEHDDLGYFNWSLAELVEAGPRSGALEEATAALRQLEGRTQASATDWALGVLARSKALLSSGHAAESLYREATERFERVKMVIHLARVHLLYGEWLRREGRRADARAQLRAAYGMFTDIGMHAFAERARQELLATGETVRKRTADTGNGLSPQESQIAHLARAGMSNPEIAAQLFLSPRTVEYHLAKVFTKLDIPSRRQLRQALPDGDGAGPLPQRP
ncbi:MAG TPA: AAA family ATPase [Streptosporangiaceae bacterium]